MSKIAITDAFLRKFKPTGERLEFTDASTTGLRVRVSPTGSISFLTKARGGADGKPRTVTLGHYPALSLREARELATRRRLELRAGGDPTAEKRAKRKAAASAASAPTMQELLREFEQAFGATKKVWAPAGPRTTRTQAGRVIERVFFALLHRDVTTLTEEDFAGSIVTYRRVSKSAGSPKATGQVSRARAYLSPVLDWAAGRKNYGKIGASRTPRLAVASLINTHDPSIDDPTIAGKRTRTLTQDELVATLPLLRYPAPQIGQNRIDPARDFRPIAMRFILLTAARLDEVCSMRWRDIDRRNNVWHKPKVKTTKGAPRSQSLPLSQAARTILRSLPGWHVNQPDAFVFPNSTGSGALGNWDRFQSALHETSSTSGWHRHDLRRTAATLMLNLNVAVSTIEQILAHTEPFRAENASGAASHYLQLTRILTKTRDPQEEALSILAEVLEKIEAGSI